MAPAVRWLSALVVLALLFTGQMPAAAHGSLQPGALSLVAQTTVLLPDGTFNAQFRIAGADANHTLDAEVYDRTTSRSAFTLSLNPEANLGRPIFEQPAAPLSELRSINTGLATVRIETHVDGRTSGSVLVSDRPAVHPVRINLRNPAGEVVDQVMTHMIIAPRDVEVDTFAFLVGLYLPMQAPVALQTDGSYSLDADALERTRLYVEALANQPLVTATIAPTPEFVWSLAQSAEPEAQEVLGLLHSVTATRELESGPFVEVDEEAWRRADLIDRYQFLLTLGRDRLNAALEPDTEPDTSVRLIEPTDRSQTLDELAAFGVQRFIVPADRVSSVSAELFPTTLTQPFELTDQNNRRLGRATALDAQLHEFFGSGATSALDAHQMLADLTVLALDQPGVARGTIIVPPPDWNPNNEFLTILFNGLRRSPQLQAATMSQFFTALAPASAAGGRGATGDQGQSDTDDTSGDGPLRRALLPGSVASTPLGSYPGEVFAATTALESYAEVVAPNDRLPLLEELLVVSAAGEFDAATRTEYIDAVYRDVRSITNVVKGPEPQIISITARDFAIPFSVENTLDVALNTVLLLESDKLEFPDGNTITKRLEPGVNDFEINVRAKTTGDSLLQVTVRSPDQTLQLAAPGRFTVRSTVFSGLGLGISLAALAVLLSWWGRQVWSNRRERIHSGESAAA